MAGVQGMGSPNQVKPASPELNIEVPEGMAFSAPNDQYVEAPPAKPSLEEIFGVTQASPSGKPSLEEIFGTAQAAPTGEGEEFTTDAPSLLQQVKDFPERVITGLQVTDKEVEQSLRNQFGDDRVRRRNDKLEYKTGDDKWRVFDKGVEPIGDLADISREVVEEIPATAATIASSASALMQTIGTGGAAAPMAPMQIAAARAAGGVAGVGLADYLQSFTGVERDPARSRTFEMGLAAVLSPVAGALGDWTAKKLVSKGAVNKALLEPNQLYKEEIQNITESVDFLKSKGLLENIPGTDTPIILSQINPSNKMARDLTKKASAMPSFAQALELQAQNMDNAVQAFSKEMGNLTSKNAVSGQQFKNTVESAIKAEGELIGKARDIIVDQAGNAEMPVPKLKSKVEAFAKEIGLDGKGLDAAVGKMVDMGYDEKAAKLIVEKTNAIMESVTNKNGRMSGDELISAYKNLNATYRNLMTRGGQNVDGLFRKKVGELRSFLADELIDKVEVISGKEAKGAYMQSLGRYKELVEAADNFSGLLEQDKVASHSLAKSIFSKGKDGLDNLEAVKVILRDSPELLDDVKGQYLQMVRAKTYNAATKKTDWNKFVKEVNSLGPEMVESAFGKDAQQTLKHFAVLGEALEGGKTTLNNPAQIASFMKKMVLAIKSPFVAGNAAVDIISQFDAEKSLAIALSREGIDAFLSTVPKESKSLMRSVLDGTKKAAQAAAASGEFVARDAARDARQGQGK